MLFENSIQTGLGGSSAPATIKQFNPSLTDTSNQIAVQVDISNIGAADDFSIVQLEVNTSGDGFVHLLFDLTHEFEKRKDREEGGGRSLPLMWPRYQARGPFGEIGGQPSNWAIRLLHSSWLNAIILIVARCAQSMHPLAAVLDATLVVNFDVVSIKKDDTNNHQK